MLDRTCPACLEEFASQSIAQRHFERYVCQESKIQAVLIKRENTEEPKPSGLRQLSILDFLIAPQSDSTGVTTGNETIETPLEVAMEA